MTTLRRLRPGDRVAIVAPASPCGEPALARGIRELASLGLEAVHDDSILLRERFVAGPPETRAKAIHDAWRDPSVAGLIAMRGGYGSQQLLPLLDPVLMREARKPLVGYSDLTALLVFYLRHGLTAIHGPMVDGRFAAGAEAYHRLSFMKTVMEDAPPGPLRPERLETVHPGDTSGLLVGGTLTQIVSLLGTPWPLEMPEDGILFLEDIGERPYRVHRMLTQLAQAGVLARAGAIVFGEFPGCDEPGGGVAIRDVLRDFTSGFPGPVLFGFPSGHTSGATWTVPFGVAARVVGGPAPVVDVLEAAVS